MLRRLVPPVSTSTAVRALRSASGEVGGVEGGAGSRDFNAQQGLAVVDQTVRKFPLNDDFTKLHDFYAGELKTWQDMFNEERKANTELSKANTESNAQCMKDKYEWEMKSMANKYEWEKKVGRYTVLILTLRQNLHLRGASEHITKNVFSEWVEKRVVVTWVDKRKQVAERMGNQEILNKSMQNEKFSSFFNCMTEKFLMNSDSCKKIARYLYDDLSSTRHGGALNVPFQLTGKPARDLVVAIFLEYFRIPYTVYDEAGDALLENPYSELGKTTYFC